MKRFVTSALVSALLGLMSSPTLAGYATFFGEDPNNSPIVPLTATPNSSAAESAFRTLLTVGVGTETFEGFAPNTVGPLTLAFPGATPGLQAVLDGGDGFIHNVPAGSTDGGGRYSIAPGSQFWDVEAGLSFVVTFNRAVAAFGFYGIDISDFGGLISLDLLNQAGGTLSSVVIPTSQGANGSTDGSVMFYGAVAQSAADDIWSIRFRTSSTNGDVFGFDNFTIAERAQLVDPNGGGGPVPLPGTVALLGAALLGLGARRKA